MEQKKKMKKKVLVGMSGGVDSSVAAVLLKEDGYDVSGVFMRIWDEKYRDVLSGATCFAPEKQDIEDVKNIADILGIKLYIVDLTKEFSETVLDYFKKEYRKGRTPNPCVVCNRFLKFGYLMEKMGKRTDFDFFATGHYAIVDFDKEKNRYLLKKGIDRNKEQSYFLFLLTQKQLSKIIFPLGRYTKKEVKKIAEDYKLPVKDKKESQDFIKGDRSVLFNEKLETGEIVDRDGNILGRHKGICFYTIGQRKGMGIAKGKPLYVIGIDKKNNRIIAGDKKDVYKSEFLVEKTNWISVEGIEKPLKVNVKVRYKHSEAPATVYPPESNYIKVIFEHPQWAITPGQAAVFYKGDVVLGGGFIRTVYR